jgi:Sortase domain
MVLLPVPNPSRRRSRVRPWRCIAVAIGLLSAAIGANVEKVAIGSAHLGTHSAPGRIETSSSDRAAFALRAAAPKLTERWIDSVSASAKKRKLQTLTKDDSDNSAQGSLVSQAPSTQSPRVIAPGAGASSRQQHEVNPGNASNVSSNNEPMPKPTLLVVPAANISVLLERLVENEEGRIEVPADTESAGWWRKRRPTSPIVLVGHLDSKTGPAVFYGVQDLRFGDQIFVSFEDGSNASYTIRQIERVSKNDFPSQRVYNEGKGEVRLVTCGGKFNRRTGHYEDNVVVYATPDGR